MNSTEIKRFLQDWDDSSKQNRVDILYDFNRKHINKTAPELDQVLGNCASLFFTRITAWLRLSYMNGVYLKVQLQAINLFIGASNGNKFLIEFIEVGGILTLLEVVGLPKIIEEDKVEALILLNRIAATGRKYKELICESYGVRAVCECLGRSETLECQEACRTVLLCLSTGNPKYQQQLYKAMITLLKSVSPEAQRIAAQILQKVQSGLETATQAIVDPMLSLLRSLHIEVQYEGCLLIKQLIQYKEVCQDIFSGLVLSLRPSEADLSEQTEEQNLQNGNSAVPAYIQQAVSAKLIGVLSKEDEQIAMDFLKLNCITNLLYAMSNDKYPDSQKQAGLTLQYFVHQFQEVEGAVRDAIGQTFFFDFMNNPSEFYLNLTLIQLEILRGSKVNI